jgi:subtilisin-like proprotein convertase family protein
MKNLTIFLAATTVGAVLGGTLPARAAIDFTGSGGDYTATATGLTQVIPDNNPSGVAYALNFGATGLSISDVTVSFATSGGYNGDIYAYLSNGSQLVQLVNQITGAPGTSGFNVTLEEGTGSTIQSAPGTVGQPLSGTSFTAAQDLAGFNTADPNGSWTLFFADLHSGDTSTLNSFSVGITAVPEPVNVALGVFGGLLLAGFFIRSRLIPNRELPTEHERNLHRDEKKTIYRALT